MKGQPRGVGIPIYVGYNIVDNLDFNDIDSKIDGQSIKAGLQLPLPIDNLPVFFGLQIEYVNYFFNDDETVDFLSGSKLDRTDWNFMLQVGIPFN